VADWLLSLPVSWMALIVFVATYLIAGGVYLVVTKFAVTEWARAFKAVSPGMWPPEPAQNERRLGLGIVAAWRAGQAISSALGH
jgi:hypothetical protein